MQNAKITVVTKRFDEEYSNYLILAWTEFDEKYKVFKETSGNTSEVEIEAALTALGLIAKMNWNAEIYCSPNIINWANGKWRTNAESTRYFKSYVDTMREDHIINYVDRPERGLYNRMERYLEKKYKSYREGDGGYE